VLVSLLLTTLPISVLVSVQVLRRRWADFDVSVRRQRYALYPFGIACMVALALVFAHFGAPQIAVRAAAAVAIANAADGLINFVYKVSAHATGAAVCATVLWAGAAAWGLPGTVAALAVGWSRVELKRHTPGQVALGWAVGVASMLLALHLPLGGQG
jgi:membrane-associated phospholipid phosphatase